MIALKYARPAPSDSVTPCSQSRSVPSGIMKRSENCSCVSPMARRRVLTRGTRGALLSSASVIGAESRSVSGKSFLFCRFCDLETEPRVKFISLIQCGFPCGDAVFERAAHGICHDQKIIIGVAAGEIEPGFTVIFPIIFNFIGKYIPKHSLCLLKCHASMISRVCRGLSVVPGKRAVLQFIFLAALK